MCTDCNDLLDHPVTRGALMKGSAPVYALCTPLRREFQGPTHLGEIFLESRAASQGAMNHEIIVIFLSELNCVPLQRTSVLLDIGSPTRGAADRHRTR
jgi:hypothetical protein